MSEPLMAERNGDCEVREIDSVPAQFAFALAAKLTLSSVS